MVMKKSIMILLSALMLVLVGCQKSSLSIGEQEAKDIALKHASIKEEETSMMDISKQKDDKDYTYIITFSDEVNTYEYEIASDGDILKSKRNAKGSTSKGSTATNTGDFNEEAALKVALEHAGVLEADAMLLKVERDTDDGLVVFEIEFRTETKSYDYEISDTGKVLDYEVENYYNDHIVYTRPTYYYSGASRYYYSGPTRVIDPKDMISDEEAVTIALEHAGVTRASATITKMERDSHEYEIDFTSGEYRYQYEVAFDGMVIKSKKKLR